MGRATRRERLNTVVARRRFVEKSNEFVGTYRLVLALALPYKVLQAVSLRVALWLSIFIVMSFLNKTIAIALIIIQIYTVDFFHPAKRKTRKPKTHEYS